MRCRTAPKRKIYLVSYRQGGRRLSDRVGPSKAKAVQVKNAYKKAPNKKNPRIFTSKGS